MRLFSIFFILSISLNVWSQLPGSTTKPFIKPDSSKNNFGAELTIKEKPITVDQALESFKTKKNLGPFLLEAKIDKVCQKKGCWMTVKGKSNDLRITFKDYSFFVPKGISGRNVLVEGTIKEEKLTLEQTKHFVSDEGGDPSKVTEARSDYQFEATGVVLKK